MSSVLDNVPYADRNPFPLVLNDGIRISKTDDGYVLERLKPDLTWEGLTIGGASVIDLGIINAVDVMAAGAVELLPFVSGRVIKEVFFTQDGFVESDGNIPIYFTISNQFILDSAGDGMASWQGTLEIRDPTDLIFRETGPLYAVIQRGAVSSFLPYFEWSAHAMVSTNIELLFRNGYIWYVSVGGVLGDTEPVWDNNSSPVTDGTAQWSAGNALSTIGAVHVHAVVADEANITDTPKVAGIEFIQQPTDAVSGESISPPITIRVLDQNGDPFTLFAVDVELALVGGNNTQDTSTDPATGIVTFSNYSITDPGTGLTLKALPSFVINGPSVISDPFDVTAP